ncbi:hypothetical protein TRAPUB_7067 [Trametes pubescens]|uniref:F-box domain-containing protein n=1 Tax=Trametes pubescens TaxID=154538 RepID=A0A1M2V4B7_TRAPU|nr:hypothetical protein TRAPUB_7067 [Trametes pubescens]
MLCVAITKLPSVNSITNIFIIIGASRLERAHGDDKLLQIYWPEDVAPLFYSLPALKRLVFAGQCITVVDNLALGTIAESSPNLVELTFTWAWNAPPRPDDERSPEDEDFPYATAWGLMELARRCPRLKKLALAVDMRFASPSYHAGVDLGLAPPPTSSRQTTGGIASAAWHRTMAVDGMHGYEGWVEVCHSPCQPWRFYMPIRLCPTDVLTGCHTRAPQTELPKPWIDTSRVWRQWTQSRRHAATITATVSVWNE